MLIHRIGEPAFDERRSDNRVVVRFRVNRQPDQAWISSFKAHAASSALGATGAVFNGNALRISLSIMDQIRKFEIKLNRDPERRKFKANQRIRITDGPFELWEGRIETLDSNYRLGVLIDLLGREVRIKLDEDQVEAV